MGEKRSIRGCSDKQSILGCVEGRKAELWAAGSAPRLECGYARHGRACGNQPDRTRFGGYAGGNLVLRDVCAQANMRPNWCLGDLGRSVCAATDEAIPVTHMQGMGVADDSALDSCPRGTTARLDCAAAA